MFKKTVDYEQGRIRRAVEFNRANESGIDPSALAQQNKIRQSQIYDELKVLEVKLGSLSRSFRESDGRTALGAKLHDALRVEREKLKEQIVILQRELALLKADYEGFFGKAKGQNQAADRMQWQESFEREFIRMAKAMLANEIFDRILIATIQKIREEERLTERQARRLGDKFKYDLPSYR
jgi:hypothetical protein